MTHVCFLDAGGILRRQWWRSLLGLGAGEGCEARNDGFRRETAGQGAVVLVWFDCWIFGWLASFGMDGFGFFHIWDDSSWLHVGLPTKEGG